VYGSVSTRRSGVQTLEQLRQLSTQSSPPPPPGSDNDEEEEKMIQSLMKYGFEDKDSARQAIAEMAKGGVAPWELNVAVERMGHRGVAALRDSMLAQSAALGSNRKPIQIHFKVPKERHEFTVEAMEHEDLEDLVGRGTEVANFIECTCGGNMACSTCHVYVDPAWMARVGSASDDEQDMLDLAFEPKDNSRLGCQLVFDKSMDGLTLTIPDSVNNMF
jgi:ferredoxin